MLALRQKRGVLREVYGALSTVAGRPICGWTRM